MRTSWSKALFDVFAAREGGPGAEAAAAVDRSQVLQRLWTQRGPTKARCARSSRRSGRGSRRARDRPACSAFLSRRLRRRRPKMRDFVHVRDAAACVAWLARNPPVNGVFNPGLRAGARASPIWLAQCSPRPATTPAHRLHPADMPEGLRDAYQYFTEAAHGAPAHLGLERPGDLASRMASRTMCANISPARTPICKAAWPGHVQGGQAHGNAVLRGLRAHSSCWRWPRFLSGATTSCSRCSTRNCHTPSYKPPAAPAYEKPGAAWALSADSPEAGRPHRSTSSSSIPRPSTAGVTGTVPRLTRAARLASWTEVMLPNYAAPFAAVGRVFAPRYRQASLYSRADHCFDDAIEAREFPYRDVRAAFLAFERRVGPHRPFIVVGVEQGGTQAARLLRDDIGPDPDLRRRLVAAYLIETVTPADEYDAEAPTPACAARVQVGCVVAWISAPWLDFGRSERIMNRNPDLERQGPAGGLERPPAPVRQPAARRGDRGLEAPPVQSLGSRQRHRPRMGRPARFHGEAGGRPMRGRHPAGHPPAVHAAAPAWRLGRAPAGRSLQPFLEPDLEADAPGPRGGLAGGAPTRMTS